MGVFGAAAAAGKLLRLPPEQMLAAFGVAYSHAAGNRQCILDGALTKRMQAGRAASAGVFAAVLAQTGFTGARNIFGGRFGFFELHQPNGYDAAALLADLGTAFRGEALSYKPYPCGRPLHAAIAAALAARARLRIDGADEIAAVTIAADPAGHGDQLVERRQPSGAPPVRCAPESGHAARTSHWRGRKSSLRTPATSSRER
jgi:2-methylcitrate dehydratase PrpD